MINYFLDLIGKKNMILL